MKTNLSESMKRAIEVVENAVPLKPRDPKDDPGYIALIQLHEINKSTFYRAVSVAYQMNLLKLQAEAAFQETRVRLEIMEQALGIEREEDDGGAA